ncbi:helix-turn-helix domain-containing protein [Bacillus sp. AFS017336]|uniref:helix-turn-helix domain-containing protein n=1 Tax=Bacillus sp. AFS017336 TaxID=2033489 RepID=UPI000BF135BD|nr:helix-turn-helix transcriptional regulator [Bacillus sp. AFS017336]PEL06034.1 hypothetical protein CN601_21165 [Bacillus sp. AFS017336]
MIEGKIIQFYRQHRNMTQTELGEGICSTTHVSKIERGLTEVSDNTITLLAERLNIIMEDEIQTYMSLDKLLKDWFQSITMKITVKADHLKEQLEAYPLIQISNFFQLYTLILTKYYLFKNNEKLAKKKLKKLENSKHLSRFEENLHLHNQAIYQLKFKNNYIEAISLLKEINSNEYNNKEFYYDLALAYHSTNSRVLAYYYANKASQFFNEHHCFSRVMEAEILMLIQLEETDNSNTSKEEYHRLIEMSLEYGLNHQLHILYHNFAYHKLRANQFMDASELYKKSMQFRDKESNYYLGSLEGYINSMTKGNLLSNKELLSLVEEGLRLAEKSNARMFIHIFKLHQFRLQNLTDEYFHFLETDVLPFLHEMGIFPVIEHYQIKLFDYYMEKQNVQKANMYAKKLVDKYRNKNQYV